MTIYYSRQKRMLLSLLFSLLLLPDLVECIRNKGKKEFMRDRDSFLQRIEDEGTVYQLTRHYHHQSCVDDLYASDLDDNLKIDKNEYVLFISKRSKGAIDVNKYSELPFSLISNFVYGSCFCSLFLGIPNCCVGTEAAIGLDPKESSYIEDNLITICTNVDAAIINEIGTFAPTINPTMEPTSQLTSSEPTETPTLVGSENPTSEPSDQPTMEPSESPITPDSETPSTEPTDQPTQMLSESPTEAVTTSEPTTSPTISPTTITSQPTPDTLLCVNFQYGIENDAGYDAEIIFNEVNNTYRSGLIIATRNITIQSLNESYPQDQEGGRYLQKTIQSQQHQQQSSFHRGLTVKDIGRFQLDEIGVENDGSKERWRRRVVFLPSTSSQIDSSIDNNVNNRRLAFYTDSYPPVINNIFDNAFCQKPEGILCAVVDSSVCVLLEEGDDEDEVKDTLLDGIQKSIQDGSFESAIPSENQLPGK